MLKVQQELCGRCGGPLGARLSHFLIAMIGVTGSAALVCGAAFSPTSGAALQEDTTPQAEITIDYPLNGSVFPPEITPPTLMWHVPSPSATRWVIQVSFVPPTQPLRIDAKGEWMQQSAIDPSAGPGLALTAGQAS